MVHLLGEKLIPVEHRDVHSLYGYFNAKSTYEALLHRNNGKNRPFILTRSYFAGS